MTMIADIDPIAAPESAVVAACKQQGEIERLKLALIQVQAQLFVIQQMSKVIGLIHCDPMFEQAQKTIKEALNPKPE